MAKPKIPVITPAVENRFWNRVDQSTGLGPKGDCWLWNATVRQDKYPVGMTIDGHRYRAGQIALLIAGKEPTEDKGWALHSCDTPTCVRPDHLRWGTKEENVADACERGTGGRRGFTPDEIRYIRSSPLRQFEIARQFNTSSACISNIRSRITHKHVI